MSIPTLVLSTWSLPVSRALAEAAREAGWHTCALDENQRLNGREKAVFYVETDAALAAAERFGAALLEPPLDLLARLPPEFRQRAVEYGCFGDLHRLKAPAFVKPADALNKVFDAGIYSDPRDIRAPRGVDPQTPVLVAEPVEWLAEYRLFILNGEAAAWSPYLSFGRPNSKPFVRGDREVPVPENAASLCKRLFSRSGVALPPAFVMDVGLIESRGWAVVEFNPAWSSGLLGSDPRKVLAVLERACQDARRLSDEDRRWVIARRGSQTQPSRGRMGVEEESGNAHDDGNDGQ